MTGAGAIGELESVRVTRILRDDIILGRRLPGSRLVERDIATELNVSRLPVREAIRALVAEGVVVSKPRSWAVVRQFSHSDVQNFAELREAIETMTFTFAAKRHDAAGRALLEGAHARQLAAAEAGDLVAARRAAGEFHEIAAKLAGNAALDELVQVFITRVRWLLGRHEDLQSVGVEHGEILEAFIARDVETLKALIPRHLERGLIDAEQRLTASAAAE